MCSGHLLRPNLDIDLTGPLFYNCLVTSLMLRELFLAEDGLTVETLDTAGSFS